jgi:hypothetical protein
MQQKLEAAVPNTPQWGGGGGGERKEKKNKQTNKQANSK